MINLSSIFMKYTILNKILIKYFIDMSFQATQYVTISSHRDLTDTTDAAAETARIKKLVGQLQNNLCNVSVVNDSTDLESLSNMDPNSLVDLMGKDFIEHLRESSGRLGGD